MDKLEALRRIVEAEPDDAAAWFLLGREAAAAGALEEARGAFAAAIERDPRYTAAYRQLGETLERLGRYGDAAVTWARGARVAGETGDLQAGKEMSAFLKRLERDRGVRPESES
jgi:cytochrome c-type biogenesis protein CcmH/NrfG